MKFIRLTFLFALLSGFLWLSSCKDDTPPEPSVEEAQLKLLSKSWKVSEVRFGSGNTDRTAEYASMTLTISGTFSATGNSYSYSLANRPALSPWPANGTWSFDANDPQNLIIRTEDSLPISYSITDTQLQLTFSYAGSGYARTSAVEGGWTFLFTAN